MRDEHGPIKPKAFAEPWHAEVFALSVALNEAGAFSWPFWAQRFSKNLKSMPKPDQSQEDHYYLQWLVTLEQILQEAELASEPMVSHWVEAWRQAYLETPHGNAVNPIPPSDPR